MIFITKCKFWQIRPMKQTGFEKDRPVLTLRQNQGLSNVMCQKRYGAVAELVGNEGGVVSGVFNLESSGVDA
jgi:hypothetical protein